MGLVQRNVKRVAEAAAGVIGLTPPSARSVAAGPLLPPSLTLKLDKWPEPDPLSGEPEYAAIEAREDGLRAMLDTCIAELRAVEAQRAEQRTTNERMVDRLTDPSQPLPALIDDIPVSPLLAKRDAMIVQRRALEEAMKATATEKERTARRLSAKCVKPMVEWYRKRVLRMVRLAIELCQLHEDDGRVLDSLENQGITSSALAPWGPARPPFASPGKVGAWIDWLISAGLLDDTPDMRQAAWMQLRD